MNKNNLEKGKYVRMLGGIWFLALALGFGIFGYFDILALLKSYQAKTWPTVEGTILSSGVSKGCGKASFLPVIKYIYTIQGVVYNGDRLSFGSPECGSEFKMQLIAEQYPVGSTQFVHFSPSNPSESVLITGHISNTAWCGIALILFLPVGLWLSLRYFRGIVR